MCVFTMQKNKRGTVFEEQTPSLFFCLFSIFSFLFLHFNYVKKKDILALLDKYLKEKGG